MLGSFVWISFFTPRLIPMGAAWMLLQARQIGENTVTVHILNRTLNNQKKSYIKSGTKAHATFDQLLVSPS